MAKEPERIIVIQGTKTETKLDLLRFVSPDVTQFTMSKINGCWQVCWPNPEAVKR